MEEVYTVAALPKGELTAGLWRPIYCCGIAKRRINVPSSVWISYFGTLMQEILLSYYRVVSIEEVYTVAALPKGELTAGLWRPIYCCGTAKRRFNSLQVFGFSTSNRSNRSELLK